MRYLHQYVGATRLAQARTHLERIAADWSAQWRIDHDREPLETSVSTDVDIRAFADSGQVGDAGGCIRFRCDDWRRLLFGQAEAAFPQDAIADSLVERARDALLQALLGNAAVAAASQPATTPCEGRAVIAATLRVRGDNNGDAAPTLHLLIDATRFDAALAGRRKDKPAPLTARDDAIGHGRIVLTLGFPLAQIGAEELRYLQKGAVIRAGQRLDQPLDLGTADEPRLLAAFLGRDGDHLAVRIGDTSRSTTRARP